MLQVRRNAISKRVNYMQKNLNEKKWMGKGKMTSHFEVENYVSVGK